MLRIPFVSTGMHGLTFLLMLLLCGACGDRTLFDTLPPEQTGVTFANTITESDSFNILDYEYVYNGGGVALADVDQDGLLDVFFSGNMVANRLYLNRGDLRFEDISEAAGIGGPDRWSTGVAVVDVNQDGLPDFYVGASTYQPGARRANQLYVNQGPGPDGTPAFADQAAAYGLADTSHTTMAAFFDYDNDGDLDVYLAINEMDQTRQPNRYRDKIDDGSSRRTDKLFRNDGVGAAGHPTFTDVSAEAGIRYEGFSLGLHVVDINEDGWKDIYVTNDYLTNDLMYVNNGDGTFTNRASDYFRHTSHSAMGNDVVDINQDGRADIIAVDMLPADNFRRKTMMTPNNYTNTINNQRYGYDFQYVRNTLQLNRGRRPGSRDPLFSEVAMLAGLHATDWSWAPVVADFDQDGRRDVIITNGFPKDITDHDFIDYHNEVHRYAPLRILLANIPSVKLVNVAFRNRGELQFEQVNPAWGLEEPSFSNGAAYGDLDNDGDLDLVVNNIDDPAFLHRNTLQDRGRNSPHWLGLRFEGPDGNRQGLGLRATVRYGDGLTATAELTPYRGYLSSVDPRLHFGLGPHEEVRSVQVVWPDGRMEVRTGVAPDQYLSFRHAEARQTMPREATSPPTPRFEELAGERGLDFTHREVDFIDFNIQPLLPHKLSQYGPGLAAADIDGDGRTDLYVSGSRGHGGTFFRQGENGVFVAEDRFAPGSGAEEPEELGVLFFDADLDGDEDLYIVGGGYEWPAGDAAYRDRLFVNEEGRFRELSGALPAEAISGGCVRAADFDRDGDLDLFVAGRVAPQAYPSPVPSRLLRNETTEGRIRFAAVEAPWAESLGQLGMVCDALWADVDADGWQDLMIVGEWMAPTLLRNEGGELRNVSREAGLARYRGLWTSLLATDLDADGDTDFLAGNLGSNTLHQASFEYPMRLYAADFDGNDGYDVIPSVFLPSSHQDPTPREYPFFNRLDMQKQIIAIKRDYMRHRDFARTDMAALLPEEERAEALVLEAGYTKSSVLENRGDGTFAVRALPWQAQVAPVYGMVGGDVDRDGHEDVLLVGNDYGTEVSTGRYDAFHGLWMRGDGQGGFTPERPETSGFFVPGDAKSMVRLPAADGRPLVVVGQNRGPLLAFSPREAATSFMPARRLEHAAILTYRDGSMRRVELPYGSSFLSQSARGLWVGDRVEQVVFLGNDGPTRSVGGGSISRR